MERVDCVVIGAGVVGLAVARQLAQAGREVIVLEREDMIGTATSSRNSEVIHAGIYYPTGSLKARSCVAGKRQLYAYCAEHGVPHRRCGKLIVATNDAQKATLEQIRAKAAANDVTDLEWLEPAAVAELEPEVFCTAALLSPSTGIIDSHSLMLAYQGDAEDRGAMLAFCAPVERGRVGEDGIRLEVGGAAPMTLKARIVVNSAGLHAPDLAARFEGLRRERLPKPYYCKGNYFTLSGARPFSRLVYPVPEQAGLGVHVTIDLGGQVRFGPDVEWVDGIDYDVDPKRAEVFYDAIRSYYPGLKDGALEPGYAGMRPKISPKGTPSRRLRDPGPARPRRAGPRQPVRDREPGPDRVAGARRGGRARVGPIAPPRRLTGQSDRNPPVFRVASVGECMVELRHRSATELELAYGGDTLNFAVYLSRLTRERGAKVDYVTALGDDAYSDGMLAMWQAEGVGAELVARLPGRLPGLYTIRVDERGERSFTYWRSHSAAREMLKDGRAERLATALAGYDLLYLSGITLSILDAPQRKALLAIADAVRAAGGRVAFDSNYRPVGWPSRTAAHRAIDAMLKRTDIALPTLDDEQALIGVPDARALAEAAASPRGRRGRDQARAGGLLPVVGRVHRRAAGGARA